LLDTPGVKARFLQEAKLLSQIRDARIVTVHQFIETDDGLVCMVLERLPGHPLSALLAGGQQMPVGRAAALICEILSGLETAHAHGIIHRDLKPSNVIVDPQDRVTIIDFGIAKKSADDADSDQPMTQTGHFVGTPAYMTPEQLKTGGVVDARTDLYAVGVMLFRMLRGRLPFEGNLSEMAAAHIYEPIPSLELEGLPPEVDRVIRRAMAKRADDRYADAAEMRTALQPFAVGDEKRSVPQTQPGYATPPTLDGGMTEARTSAQSTGDYLTGALPTGAGETRPGNSRRAIWPVLVLAVAGGLYLVSEQKPSTEPAGVRTGWTTSPRPDPPPVVPKTGDETAGVVEIPAPTPAAMPDASAAAPAVVVDAASPTPPDAAVEPPPKKKPLSRPRRRTRTSSRAQPAEKPPKTEVLVVGEPIEKGTPVVRAPRPTPVDTAAEHGEWAREIEAQLRRCRCQKARKVLAKMAGSADLHGKWKAKVDQCKPRLPGRPCRYTP
jgi:hypothetical protein